VKNHEYVEYDTEDMPWECWMCGREADFDAAPYGWIRDSHPLCHHCADLLLDNPAHKWHNSLSYHYKTGEIKAVV
jgi:hypothetical protein